MIMEKPGGRKLKQKSALHLRIGCRIIEVAKAMITEELVIIMILHFFYFDHI